MSTPRPSRHSEYVIKAVAAELLKDVRSWIDDPTVTDQSIVQDLENALKWSDVDGYEVAKRLDDKGWSPDSDLVERLESAVYLFHKYHRKQEVDWVKLNGTQAPEIGNMVTFKDYTGKEVAGEVMRNEPDGKSVIHCPLLGHVKEGMGTHGLYVEWERLTPAEAKCQT
jgi:hypothetical protein